MHITTAEVSSGERFIATAKTTLIEKLHGDAPECFPRFVERYFHQYPLDELVGHSWDDLFGCVYGWWRFIQKREPDQNKVKVFNPTLEEDRWESPHTVVAVLVKDMPFLVDSVRLEIIRRNIPVHTIKSTILQVRRNEAHQLIAMTPSAVGGAQEPGYSKEALLFFEINRTTAADQLHGLADGINTVLMEVASAVAAYKPLAEQAQATLKELSHARGSVDAAELARSEEFLQWLVDGHFTFLGYCEYDLVDHHQNGGRKILRENVAKRKGIITLADQPAREIDLVDHHPGVAKFYAGNKILNFAKSSERSRVHRAAYPDYVIVKRFDSDGIVCGECRFIGLYTAAVYNESPRSIPLVRDKIRYVLDNAGLEPASHDGKLLRQVLETFPRDELLQSTAEELYSVSVRVAQINERHRVRLFMRAGPYGKFVSALVYVPRDLFSSEIRQKVQTIIGQAVAATEQEFTTYFSESILARVHLVFKVDPAKPLQFDERELERQIIDVIRSWSDHLGVALYEAHGEERGVELYNQFKNGFSHSYREDYDARAAVRDIDLALSLANTTGIGMSFYQALGASERSLRFKIIRQQNAIPLSDVIPLLENLGLRVIGEHPYHIKATRGDARVDYWLHDFELEYGLPVAIDVNAVRVNFQEAFAAVWQGHADSDEFNRLVLGARLDWREVALLRAYANYLKQTTFNFSQSYIANTLAHHLDITRNLVALFKASFDPRLYHNADKDPERIERLKAKIIKSLDEVDNLNEDRIIRRYLDLLNGTLRTNFYQLDAEGSPKPCISIKFAPQSIPDIPEPRPKYEIFVYSPRVEGVHLRGGKVARGGLRWSDRFEDYRTEVLGLVKAQQVKNAIIVPGGAKGGFIAKRASPAMSREEFQAEGIACYQCFVSGLLDITDNLVDNKVVPPENVVRHDDDDPYLVVAADKGTATFSDIANKISKQYNHWLGDAFASGGSQGYDHKGMGITAKGAWVGVQRHFREKNIDIQSDDFSVVGIGDMAGDVFGNGMLLSKHICLVAAFNHLHIFIDPNPDAGASMVERQRLFALPKSSWADYNRELISEGGGIFNRSAKSIAISPAMKERFAITENALPPTELMNRLLQAPVDLIWNGGIGTYVKSSRESHNDVGDKANDALRVNGNQLRCKVFGEGGNLGMTQLGRVEYALNGGALNTDFIDNSAGVDCSDHEVNIKILLNEMVANDDLTEKQRNQLLAEMTDDVAKLVLTNNYQQTQALSVAHFQSVQRMGEYRRFISYLQNEGRLKRRLEFIPEDEELLERQVNGQGLTRPELAILVSYSKVMLKEALATGDVSDDSCIALCLEEPFPKPILKKFKKQLLSHRLRKEIIATQLANDMVNTVGFTFFQRMHESTGAKVDQVAKAYVTAKSIYQVARFKQEVEQLDNKVPAALQLELLANMARKTRRATRWFLRNRRSALRPEQEINEFAPVIAQINKALPDVLRGTARDEWDAEFARLVDLGVPSHLAAEIAVPSNLYSGLGMVEAARQSQTDVLVAAEAFYLLGDKIQLHWFANAIAGVKVDSYWQAMARETYLDDVESQLRMLAVSIIRFAKSYGELELTIELWLQQNTVLVQRWRSMMTELQAAQGADFAMFSVALRELLDLVQVSQHCEFLTVPSAPNY